jgi:hypothetical protein
MEKQGKHRELRKDKNLPGRRFMRQSSSWVLLEDGRWSYPVEGSKSSTINYINLNVAV